MSRSSSNPKKGILVETGFERDVLYILMFDEKADVTLLEPDYFTSETHQEIFKTALALRGANKVSDMSTLSSQLPSRSAEIMDIAINTMAGFSSYKQKVAHLRLLANARKLQEIFRTAYHEIGTSPMTAIDLVEEAQKAIYELLATNHRDEFFDTERVLADVLDPLLTGKQPKMIQMPFYDLRRIFTNFRPQELTIVGARPSMGKTVFGVAVALEMAKTNPVAFLSLDMSRRGFWHRILANLTGIGVDRLDDGKITDKDIPLLNQAREEFLRRRMYVDTDPRYNLTKLRGKIRQLVMHRQIEVLFIDWLGKIQNTAATTERQYGEIAEELKALSKEFDIHICALHQLSRSIEGTTQTRKKDDIDQYRPRLSDLRHSGAIEQEADNVIFLMRPEYYELAKYPDGTSTSGVMEVIMRKVRNGRLGMAKVKVNLAASRLHDLSHVPPSDPKQIADMFDNTF